MIKHTTIHDLPPAERPYEKCEMYGPAVLSDAELLAVIIRTGTGKLTSVELARKVLEISDVYPGLLGLYHARMSDLTGLQGIGRVKAIQLMCIAELSKRLCKLHRDTGEPVRDPKEIAEYYMEELRALEVEQFYMVLLDASSRIIHREMVFKGTINMSTVSAREPLRVALERDAAYMIILHNHPSGDPTPSGADNEVTEQFQIACQVVGIPLVDHIIVGDGRYVSYRENGLIE